MLTMFGLGSLLLIFITIAIAFFAILGVHFLRNWESITFSVLSGVFVSFVISLVGHAVSFGLNSIFDLEQATKSYMNAGWFLLSILGWVFYSTYLLYKDSNYPKIKYLSTSE